MPTFNNDGNDDNILCANPAERDQMKDFWIKHSTKANMQEMLLDSNAEEISDNDLPEIMSSLPSFKAKTVLELGAGIGRFTKVLAQQAQHVTAVDFIEKFIEKNQELNADLNNISYIASDVMKLTFGKKSFDMIFSNWLLMYLNDTEILGLIQRSLHSLKDNGYFFFRESCFHSSGDIKKVSKDENPTKYRSPREYVDFFLATTIEENGDEYGFELVFVRPNRTYIELKNNGNQVVFLFQKKKLEEHHGFKTLKEFFDHRQYSTNGILRYEKIFGRGFVSTGGEKTTSEFLKTLDLKPGQRVLDVGCGIGGGDFFMAEKYDVEVFGLDLSSNMISICWDRAQETTVRSKVRFEIGDVTKHDYPAKYFDVIYSRDCLLHIADKKSLMKKFMTWLKPGGKVFITDYACGPKPWSDEFTVYVEQRGYTLFTPLDYQTVIEEAGFVNVKCEDQTDTFVDYLNKELFDFRQIKSQFIEEFGQADFDCIVEGWKEKRIRCDQGHQKWVVIYAEKKQS